MLCLRRLLSKCSVIASKAAAGGGIGFLSPVLQPQVLKLQGTIRSKITGPMTDAFLLFSRKVGYEFFHSATWSKLYDEDTLSPNKSKEKVNNVLILHKNNTEIIK